MYFYLHGAGIIVTIFTKTKYHDYIIYKVSSKHFKYCFRI